MTIQRGTNGNGPAMTIEPKIKHIGVYDNGRILLQDGPHPTRNFMPDDVVTMGNKVWRNISSGQRQQWEDVTGVWEWQAESALMADIAATQDDASSKGQ